MRKFKAGFVAALALAAAVTAVPRTSAQAGLTLTSGIQVQNLNAATDATIQIDFYDSTTQAKVGSGISDTITKGSSKTYFPLPSALGTFKGSAVVTSNQPVAAITNLVTPDFSYAGSATGLPAGAQRVGLPLVMRGNNGFNTFFSVQNAGTADATVNITYTPLNAANGNPGSETAFTLKPGAAKTFDQSTKTELGTKFVGSATITGNQDLVATVGEVSTTGIRVLLVYDGFSGVSGTTTSVSAPLVMANNSGFFTGIGIQNVGAQATKVTVSYGKNTAGAFQPVADTAQLNPGETTTLLQSGGQWGSNKYIGSATITAEAGKSVVAVVNQLKIGAGSASKGTAYEGLNPAGLTSKVSAPLVMAQNGGYFTGVQCQNAGAAAADITISYSRSSVGTLYTPPARTFKAVAKGSSVTVLQTGADFPSRYVGSATITSTGDKVACLVNQLNPTGTGDTFLTYDAISFAP